MIVAKMITPKGFNIRAERAAIDRGLMAAVEDAKVLFRMTYHNWDNANVPVFEVIGPRTRIDAREVIYRTTSTPYVYVANGTEAHNIPNSPGFLRFPTGGMPKTRPGRFQSMAGVEGTNWRTAKQVRHPGIEARYPQKEVAKRVQPTVVGTVQREITTLHGG